MPYNPRKVEPKVHQKGVKKYRKNGRRIYRPRKLDRNNLSAHPDGYLYVYLGKLRASWEAVDRYEL